MKEALSSRPPIVEVLFPRTPDVGDSYETIAAQIELTRWAAQTLQPVFKKADRSSHSADFFDACNDATGVSNHYIDHYSESGLLTPELKEKISLWQES